MKQSAIIYYNIIEQILHNKISYILSATHTSIYFACDFIRRTDLAMMLKSPGKLQNLDRH